MQGQLRARLRRRITQIHHGRMEQKSQELLAEMQRLAREDEQLLRDLQRLAELREILGGRVGKRR